MWLGFAVLAVVGVCLQTAFVPHVEIFSARPDVMLLLAVFYALHARGYDGLIAAWLCGLLVGLCSLAGLGLFCCLYGVVVLPVYAARAAVFRDHLATHLVFTLVCALLVQLASALYVDWRYPVVGSVRPIYLQAMVSVLYTTALVPLVQMPLVRLHRLLGLRRPTESDTRPRRRRRG